MDASSAWNWLNSDINLQYFQISTDEIEVRIMTKSQLCKINYSYRILIDKTILEKKWENLIPHFTKEN